ncbi:MAG TPA: 2-oxo acid dehydrogenase subunit E2, partial [Nocardioidaceae bacterium]|nr:2-oxo acid dehydrogenase subunit E2 [Nocardioidaceae bacterium]
MAESSKGASPVDSEADDNPLAAFGANEWLVDEMYEQYQRDPDSVDKVWWDFFEHNAPDGNSGSGSNGTTKAPEASTEATPAPRSAVKTAPKTEAKPAPKSAPKAETAAKPAARTESTSPAKPVATPSGDTSPRADARPSAPSTASPVPKEPEPPAAAEASDEPTLTVLRGAPARTAQNMDASLTVPTATSVRSVPVKLLWDNRIVINNHLSRARGGKVSFTHIIGYALVKALKTMPEMNNGFDVIDGKPNLITPAHINL